MKFTKKTGILAILFSILTSASFAATQEDFNSLIESEKAFSKTVVEKGTKEAFLAYLADDGVLFRPQPVNGKKYYNERGGPGGMLSWVPENALLSHDANLGVTSGPWEYRESAGAKPTGFGHYVSVWRRQKDKSWKVAADLGISYPKAYHKIDKVDLQRSESRAVVIQNDLDLKLEKARLMDVDLAFSKASESGGTADAYLANSVEDILLYRFEEMPMKGYDAINKLYRDTTVTLSWTPSSGEVAPSGDFGYTFGILEIKLKNVTIGKPKGESDSYLRVWERGKDNRWRMVLDITVPISTPLKKN